VDLPQNSQEWLDNKKAIWPAYKDAMSEASDLEKQADALRKLANDLHSIAHRTPIRILDHAGQIVNGLYFYSHTTKARVYYKKLGALTPDYADRWSGECKNGNKIHPDDLKKFWALTK